MKKRKDEVEEDEGEEEEEVEKEYNEEDMRKRMYKNELLALCIKMGIDSTLKETKEVMIQKIIKQRQQQQQQKKEQKEKNEENEEEEEETTTKIYLEGELKKLKKEQLFKL
ncbi:hypothetical protein DFA_03219 [Cavenderia fasciculata]|uniref:Uncharacterized protein n=1 Tax=Cavenderia fasciculata TaxID=261658 RepID=F4PGY9_CACFS|nr:uncharacterized protein DFA_03219 [Cavenderia fasciculata]EGG24973.1 hypothetical protein DFA_03219 [Cavenderia fasciculata]|eukprot:XP_004362824.1 hypothetical protein DFA_03219 [Cavenderia fasciculata]